MLLSLRCEAGYCCCRCDAKLVSLPLRDVKLVLPLRDANLVLLLDAKLLLRDAKVVINVAVRLDVGDRGRCCCSCHYRHKVFSFFPHCLEGISTIAIGRDCIAGIAAPNQVAIYNSVPTRSLKIAYFKWSGIGEDAKDRRLVRPYVLGRDFDSHGVRFWKEPFFEPEQKTGKRKVNVGTQLTWRETHYRLGGKEKFTKTLAELFASVVEGERVPVFVF